MSPEQAYDDDRGYNMNRTWPGRATGKEVERLSHAIYRAVGEEATHVLDLHCWEKHAAPGLLVHEAPGVRAVARELGVRFVHVRTPSTNTLSGYFHSTNRMGMTYECSGQYILRPEQVEAALGVIVCMARAIGLLDDDNRALTGPVLFSDESRCVDVRARQSGLFVKSRLDLCQPVEKGARLGSILSDTDLRDHPVTAPRAGYLQGLGVARPKCDVSMTGHHPFVEKGDTVARIRFYTA